MYSCHERFQMAITIGSSLLRLTHMALLDSTDSELSSNVIPVRTLSYINSDTPAREQREFVTSFSANIKSVGRDKQMKYVLDWYSTQFLLTKNQFSKEWASSQRVGSSLVLWVSVLWNVLKCCIQKALN